jgi:arsenite-transporting ATPase
MRVVLVTGKGGVGKTTVSAATGLRAAEFGHRTLVTSTDPAHSLADAFDIPLGDVPRTIFDGLDVQQIDAQMQLAKHWGEIHQQLKKVFDWGGVKGIEAEEFLVFPGMDELFSLLQVKDHADSDSYDTIIVDCAPTAETLRLLSLPEVLSWYFERVLPTERRLMRAARPMLSKMTNLPVPGEEVFDAAEGVFEAVEGVKALLSDPAITTARLVVNPEKMVVNEARRTYTYLGLFGYAVDSVIVNRVLPEAITDSYFDAWREVQARHIEHIEQSFQEVSILPLRLFDQEMVGVGMLRILAEELYGATDPVTGFEGASPFTLVEEDEEVIIELAVPFADEEELDVLRRGAELYVTVGPYRRSFVLPDALLRRRIAGAKHADGVLRVTFGD